MSFANNVHLHAKAISNAMRKASRLMGKGECRQYRRQAVVLEIR